MWAFWRKCWKALITFKNNENTSKYYGNARFTNAEVLVKMMESNGNLKTNTYTSNNYGKARLVNTGMLAKMLESIEHLEKH